MHVDRPATVLGVACVDERSETRYVQYEVRLYGVLLERKSCLFVVMIRLITGETKKKKRKCHAVSDFVFFQKRAPVDKRVEIFKGSA